FLWSHPPRASFQHQYVFPLLCQQSCGDSPTKACSNNNGVEAHETSAVGQELRVFCEGVSRVSYFSTRATLLRKWRIQWPGRTLGHVVICCQVNYIRSVESSHE